MVATYGAYIWGLHMGLTYGAYIWGLYMVARVCVCVCARLTYGGYTWGRSGGRAGGPPGAGASGGGASSGRLSWLTTLREPGPRQSEAHLPLGGSARSGLTYGVNHHMLKFS